VIDENLMTHGIFFQKATFIYSTMGLFLGGIYEVFASRDAERSARILLLDLNATDKQ